MKIMVTGGAGFIGSHLVNSLQNDGHELMVLDNLATGTMSNFDSRLLKYGDVTELTELGINFKPEVIIHLAGEFRPQMIASNPVMVANTNIKGTAEVMNFAVAKKVKRVVNISSAAVYGNQESYPISEDQAQFSPLSIYGQSKLSAEWISTAIATQHGIELNTLRLFNVYGPGQGAEVANAVIPTLISDMLAEVQPEIHGDGSQTRDFVYVSDVVEAIKLATLGDTFYVTANISLGLPTPVLEVYQYIKFFLNSDLKPKYLRSRQGDIRESTGSNKKAQELLKWQPKVALYEGLQSTVNWWKSCV